MTLNEEEKSDILHTLKLVAEAHRTVAGQMDDLCKRLRIINERTEPSDSSES